MLLRQTTIPRLKHHKIWGSVTSSYLQESSNKRKGTQHQNGGYKKIEIGNDRNLSKKGGRVIMTERKGSGLSVPKVDTRNQKHGAVRRWSRPDD